MPGKIKWLGKLYVRFEGHKFKLRARAEVAGDGEARGAGRRESKKKPTKLVR